MTDENWNKEIFQLPLTEQKKASPAVKNGTPMPYSTPVVIWGNFRVIFHQELRYLN